MNPAFIAPSTGNSSFLIQSRPSRRFRNVISHRPIHHYRTAVPLKAVLPSEETPPSTSGGDPGAPPPSDLDSFSGFAAGPASSTRRRISRPGKAKPKEDEPTAGDSSDPTVSASSSESKTLSDADPEISSDSSPTSAETKRAVRALGSLSESEVSSFSTRKTAADFIAEGVTDDVDEASPFVPADIRFGIDDIKDPFKEESDKAEEDRIESEQQEMEDSIGQTQDVTGDGGVAKTLLTVGTGEFVTPGAKVRVEYTGKLEDGSVFDSSRKRGGGFSFNLGAGTVIKGWEAAVATMRVGEVAEFSISPTYAYGRRGMPPVIPGNAMLTFEIELIEATGGAREEVRNMPDFNPNVARTPEEITKTYESRLETQAERRKKMSLLDRFYIISPFMSQTGEKPPWWINPNITFALIAFFTVLGTYLVFLSGAVHIGYVEQPVDVNIFK